MDAEKRDSPFFQGYTKPEFDNSANRNDRAFFTERDTEGRLHKYLKELRKGMPPPGERKNRRDIFAWDNTMDRVDTSNEDKWKRMMRLRGTVADSKFTENSAVHMDQERWTYMDGTSDLHRDRNLFYEGNTNEEIDEELPDGFYGSPHGSQPNSDYSSVSGLDDVAYMDILDHYSLNSFMEEVGADDVASSDPKDGHPPRKMFNPERNSTMQGQYYNDLKPNDQPFYDDSALYERCPEYYGDNKEQDEYRGLAISLRNIADQIESISTTKVSHSGLHYQRYQDLIIKLQSQNEKLMELRRKIATSDKVKRELTAKLTELQSQPKGSFNERDLVVPSLTEVDSGFMSGEPSETLPPFEVESSSLGPKARSYIKTLKANLYAGLYHSLTAAFQTNLYKLLHDMPDVVHCKEIVSYINECIISDAGVIQTRLKQSALRQGVIRIYLEEHLSPFANRYPFPAEFEQKVVSEIEASHPLRRFSTDSPRKRDHLTELGGIVMNRAVLRSIFKYSHMNNLYNYLFTALYWDNFRVVDILKDAIGAKFLDFQMMPSYKDRVRHPLMWSFGDANNATQAYRYMRHLDFEFSKFPVDPNDGENLWHRIVKGDAVKVVQSLKSCMMYTDFLYRGDQQGKTPLDIARGNVLKELLTLIVIDMAAKGSEMYKKSEFDLALKFYSDAIEKQLEAMAIKSDHKDDVCDVNLGKLYYNKARSLLHLDRWTETVDACEMCLNHIPTYTNAYITCIQAYEKLLDWESAAKMCFLMSENCGIVDDEKMQALHSQLGATMFQILGLSNDAAPKDIKHAFNQLCKQWHPDKVGVDTSQTDLKRRSMNHFNRIYNAREKLLDDSLREVERQRPETHYMVPEPIMQSSRTCHEDDEKAPPHEECNHKHKSTEKEAKTNGGLPHGQFLQTTFDRLQHQIDEINATG